MKPAIRQATGDDLDIIVEFQLKMAFETEGLRLPQESIRPGVKAALEDENKGIYYIAEVNGEVAGSLLITREWSDWRNGWVSWIQSVFVKKEYRRKGIYSALYQHIKNKVLKDEFKGIRLYVDNTNIKARKVYSALGMDDSHYRLFEWMKDY